jgi:2-polyprenyl-6-methoxyphenol hydroxylase-like FAD-dependent oxidoreductase
MSIIIAGASIGGLTAALCLHAAGIDCRPDTPAIVFEHEIGSGDE